MICAFLTKVRKLLLSRFQGKSIKIFFYRVLINVTFFKEKLSLLHLRHMDYNGTVNEIYDAFMRTLSDICNDDLPLREYNLKEKDIKSSKKKQRLCIKFL